MVKTSFSSASLQMGRRCARQKALLQVAQPTGAARCLRLEEDDDGGLECEESGMMVLFVKQVHLQNEGGAAIC